MYYSSNCDDRSQYTNAIQYAAIAPTGCSACTNHYCCNGTASIIDTEPNFLADDCLRSNAILHDVSQCWYVYCHPNTISCIHISSHLLSRTGSIHAFVGASNAFNLVESLFWSGILFVLFRISTLSREIRYVQ